MSTAWRCVVTLCSHRTWTRRVLGRQTKHRAVPIAYSHRRGWRGVHIVGGAVPTQPVQCRCVSCAFSVQCSAVVYRVPSPVQCRCVSWTPPLSPLTCRARFRRDGPPAQPVNRLPLVAVPWLLFSLCVSRAGPQGPSPGDYTLPSMAAELMKKRETSRGGGVFGCTTKRFFKGIVSTDGDPVPGPGEYMQVRVCGLSVACLWPVCGLSVACLWPVCGLSVACLGGSDGHIGRLRVVFKREA